MRADASPLAGPTCIVRERGQVIASVQYWPVRLIDREGLSHGLTLLGPIGVLPSARGRGIGIGLMQHSIAIADRLGRNTIVLIGDLEYYGRFGFSADATQQWQLPGPVEHHRVLLRNPAGIELPIVADLVAEDAGYNLRAG
ncbi:MAG: GNAT family N-acetyltransferase [Polymorphobacter sp.]